MFGSPPAASDGVRIEHGQGVRVLLEAACPVGEKHRRTRHQGAGGLEAFVDLFGRQGGRPLLVFRTVDALDVQFGGLLGCAVQKRLPHDQRAALRRHRQPVPLVAPAAHDQLEAAVLADVELGGLDVAGGRHPPTLPVVSGMGAETEILHGVAPAGDPVVVVAADGGRLVVVVGVVAAQLDGLVGDPVEYGSAGVGVFHESHQAAARQAAEVAVALGLVEGVAGCAGETQRCSGGLEGVAEFVPGAAADHALLGDIGRCPAPQPLHQ